MKKVLTFGVYDYFHYGHLRLFKQAKQYGDYLIVAVQEDDYILKFKPETKVMYNIEQRIEIINELRSVDEVITYKVVNEDIVNIDFDVLALGEDHTSERFVKAEQWAVDNKKEVVRLKRTQGICSSDIKKSINK